MLCALHRHNVVGCHDATRQRPNKHLLHSFDSYMVPRDFIFTQFSYKRTSTPNSALDLFET
uniref:Uncharacterized protein n=1 Tax=Cucumis melo TaxID=3656 RepID=A0A9I9E9Z6_CUCME